LTPEVPDISQVATPDSVDSAETAEMESPDELLSDPLTSESMDGAGVAEEAGLQDEVAETPVLAEPVGEPVVVPSKLEAMPPEIALTPKGGFLLPKTLATRVEGVVPYVPPDTPLVIVPDRRKSKSAGNGLAERRVAELIRRLAQPAGHHSKPPPSDPTDPA
jgi:hypothetical protein